MTKKKAKVGRPQRAVASKKALSKVDLSTLEPLAILREIAGDMSAPASARVNAARALLADDRRTGCEQQAAGNIDAVSRGALKILNGGRA